MPLIVSQINAPLGEDASCVMKKALKKASLKSGDVLKAEIYKTSLDARNKENIHFVHSIYLELSDSATEKKIAAVKGDVSYCEIARFSPCVKKGAENKRVAVIGFGPAGIFAALVLCENGIKPIIFERGGAVEERISSVEEFFSGGELNENTNVQFGEGGAGTFSDGKLTSRIKDSLCRYVLKRFCDFGAPAEIMTKAKPHIGTDKLREIIKNIREHIISLGGEVYFNTRVTDFEIKDSKVISVTAGDKKIPFDDVILAIGHSARDTFSLLYKKGVAMEAKPFSVGVRIEHTQESVDRSLYGKHAGNPMLPKGEYQLSKRDKHGRGVYTFCMCPGGYVVASQSEKNTVVTNGMSEFSRGGVNANSAVAVSVSPMDFGKNPLDGVKFQRELERAAFDLAGGDYSAPATTVGGFLSGAPSLDSDIRGSYPAGLRAVELRRLFPKFITDMLETGLYDFSKKMKCFGDRGAVITAPETRTSSPVRITRTENMNSLTAKNLYPCGEGAGYAGGIMSSAVDGIKAAVRILEK